MLLNSSQSISKDIDDMVRDLLLEDAAYDRQENRSAHREHLFRSVHIDFRDPKEEMLAISRNISPLGIGLITDAAVAEKRMALLTIEKLDGTRNRVLAESRWCRTYGKHWFISGWQFLSIR
ncbi:MAG: hypothetical protein NXI32_19375 [bacterium]|nr:hypothetical protein [bacterium]